MSPSPKPSLAPLKTSQSPTFPSEMHESPLPSGKSENVKQEETQKTPMTPPQAYTDFLSALMPASMSALPSANAEKHFDRSASFSHPSTTTSASFSSSGNSRPTATPLTIPSPLPSASSSSAALRPQSAKTPSSLRPLRTSPITEYPRSASSSARPMFSPSDSPAESGMRYFLSPRSANSPSGRRVSMRHVITRTVTYKRTPLDPAPKGKRRKTDDQEKKE